MQGFSREYQKRIMTVDGAIDGKFPGHSGMVALLPVLCIDRQPTDDQKPIRLEQIQIKRPQIRETCNMKIMFIKGHLGKAQGGVTSVTECD